MIRDVSRPLGDTMGVFSAVSYLTSQMFLFVESVCEPRLFAVPQHTWDWMDRTTLQAVIRDVHRKCLRDARAESLRNVFSSVGHFVVVDSWD
jgi:hypothetical protein